MKKKHITAVLALLLAGLGAVVAPPANAGDGPSEWCSDGSYRPGATEKSVTTNPITLGYEYDPGYQVMVICYSTSPAGAPGGLTGGVIKIDWSAATGASSGTVTVLSEVECKPDAGVVLAPVCDTSANGAVLGSPSAGRTSSATYTSMAGGPCAYVLGVQRLPTCTSATDVSVANGDLPSASMTPGVCLLYNGASCAVWLPGVTVAAGQDATANTVTVQAGSLPGVGYNIPKQCYGTQAC